LIEELNLIRNRTLTNSGHQTKKWGHSFRTMGLLDLGWRTEVEEEALGASEDTETTGVEDEDALT